MNGRKTVFATLLAGVLYAGLASAESERTPRESPRIEKHEGTKAKQRHANSARAPTPVTIVESPEQAAHAQERERNADQHEAADLQAQRDAADAAQRAAASAERQEVPAIVQIWLAIVGTVIAVIALFSSILSTRSSNRTSVAELRAYVMPEKTNVIHPKNQTDPLHLIVDIKNFGQTPAYQVALKTGVSTGPYPWPFDFPDMGELNPAADMAPSGVLGSSVYLKNCDPMDQATRDGIPKGTHAVYVFGIIQYRHTFLKASDPPARSRFVFCYRGPWEDNPTTLLESFPKFWETT